VALGYFRNFKSDNYSLEVETYYKKVKNRLDYIDGADLIANKAIEQIILNGQLRSYGLEVMLRKNKGKNGWISYQKQQTQDVLQDRAGSNFDKAGFGPTLHCEQDNLAFKWPI
jgi:hypothetical protein